MLNQRSRTLVDRDLYRRDHDDARRWLWIKAVVFKAMRVTVAGCLGDWGLDGPWHDGDRASCSDRHDE